MKTLHSFNATLQDTDKSVEPEQASHVRVTQSQKGFWRRIRASANGLYFESSAGAQVFVSHDDMWKLVEAHEPACCKPNN